MALGYNPGDKSSDGPVKAQPGTYAFTIEEAQEKTFASGNRGLRVVMQVGAFADRDVKVFDNFMYLPQSLWKLGQFLAALGFDYNNPPDEDELIGCGGRAKYVVGKNGYLEAEEYLPAKAAQSARPTSGPVQMQTPQLVGVFDDDSVPF
jgi:hypothetical protein